MPYKTVDDLPKGVKNNLPKEAQKIYLSAFNSAYSALKCGYMKEDDERKKCDTSTHVAAWRTVKESYAKDEKSGKWGKIKT